MAKAPHDKHKLSCWHKSSSEVDIRLYTISGLWKNQESKLCVNNGTFYCWCMRITQAKLSWSYSSPSLINGGHFWCHSDKLYKYVSCAVETAQVFFCQFKEIIWAIKSGGKMQNNIPGTRGGSDSRDRTLTVKSWKNTRKSSFFWK